MQEFVSVTKMIVRPIAVFYFMFTAFRRLKSDYPHQQIAQVSLLTLLAALGLNYLALRFSINLSFLLSLISLIVIVLIYAKKQSWRFWAVMEVLTLPGMATLILMSFGNWYVMAVGVLVLLSNFYWKNYRRFSWYPSGKIGFIFLVDLAEFAMINIGLDFWQNRLVKLVSWVIVFWLSVAGLILRAGKKKQV